jgi:glycogen debranching enzyme
MNNQLHTLNFGNTFAIFDRNGDIDFSAEDLQGLYHRGTRFIHDMRLELNGRRPLLLSSNIKYENELLSVDLTNPAMHDLEGKPLKEGVVHIARTIFLQEGTFHEMITLHNYGPEAYTLQTGISFEADFKDIFEIRGHQRKRRGELLPPRVIDSNCVLLSYRGLDNKKRETIIRFDPYPEELQGGLALFNITLAPKESVNILCAAELQTAEQWIPEVAYAEAFNRIGPALERGKAIIAHVHTSNEQFNHWLNRSKNDLLSLLTRTDHGVYPYAGVPWYNTIFGRDGIITALATLWAAPDIAKGVLGFLAGHQSNDTNSLTDATPGKILHEMRYGEMAALGEVPFLRYYGSIDTTPLFVVLAGQYLKRTNDLLFIAGIWENILAAIKWIDTYGDTDGDGFIEYERKAASGLVNQGWKDSYDAVSYEDGQLASSPVALCEIQGYVYEAKLQAAYIAKRSGHYELADKWEQEAAKLKEQFNTTFWDESLGSYVLALDGRKRPCRVLSSNAGHCLFSGIATPEKAAITARTLMSERMFSGWGIRTLGTTAVRYNPMSYHNGSVWPHDTALIAAGFARYGMKDYSLRLMQGLFEASLFIPLQRLPELFCGFELRKGEAPTSYPNACSPQAWSVAAAFLLLQSCLQLEIDMCEKRIYLRHPQLPTYMDTLRISALPAGKESVRLEIWRQGNKFAARAVEKPEPWDVILIN